MGSRNAMTNIRKTRRRAVSRDINCPKTRSRRRAAETIAKSRRAAEEIRHRRGNKPVLRAKINESDNSKISDRAVVLFAVAVPVVSDVARLQPTGRPGRAHRGAVPAGNNRKHLRPQSIFKYRLNRAASMCA